MKIDPRYHPEFALDPESREDLRDPYFDAQAKAVIATDGYIMVVLPVTPDADEPSHRLPPGVPSRRFTDWTKGVPRLREGDPGTVTFAVDLALLQRAALAIGVGDDGKIPVCITVSLDGRDAYEVRELGYWSEPSPARAYVMGMRLAWDDISGPSSVVVPKKKPTAKKKRTRKKAA